MLEWTLYAGIARELIPLASARCVIVDSTRRGKAMPDALSKTIPIWCAVINWLLFGDGEVYLPEEVVGCSESAQIREKIDGWVKDAKVSDLDLMNEN
jgi:tRNA A64-2'-O-ribosylphosphate transferase